MDERLLREFLAEAEELVEGLCADLAELRAVRRAGPARRELVARVFRRVHTAKGTAAAAGLEAAGRVAHEFESLLDAVRTGRAPLDDEALDAFDEAAEALAETLDDAARGATGGAAPESLLARLRGLASRAQGDAAFDEAAAMLPVEVERALSAHERRRLSEAVGEGARAYLVLAEFGLADFDGQYRALSESLKEAGEVLATQPFVNDVGPERVGFRILYASAQARPLLEERAARFGATLAAAWGDEEGASGAR
ncbi:MAG TPA: Hpt domain-containing protein, partial [Pyrinomonadaceae bacterium]